MIDEPVAVDPETAPPLPQLLRWLASHGITDDIEISQFPGGASNLTYLLRSHDRELVLRTAPPGTKAAASHDMGREARVMTALNGRFPVPRVVAQCEDPEVIGQPFYLMERVRGVILRADPPAGMDFGAPVAAALADRMIRLLAELHAADPVELGLADLDRGPGYVARQVAGWNRRYRAVRLPGTPSAEDVMAWLAEHQPGDVRRCLIHNDWRLDNLILDERDPTQVLAVLDWEMATVGDPLMDLGSALAYWVQADDDPLFLSFRRQPSHVPGMPGRAEVVRRYCELSGLDPGPAGFAFYEVFGLFRLAVIAQQISFRYVERQSGNPAQKVFAAAVAALVDRCEGALQT